MMSRPQTCLPVASVDGNGGNGGNNAHHPGVGSNNMESNVVDSSSLPPECEDIHERDERDGREESTETNGVENVENRPHDLDNLEKEGCIAVEPSQDSSSLPSDAVAARAGDDHEADPSAELPTDISTTPISASSANTTSVDQLPLPTSDNHVEGSVADNDAASSTALTTERVDDDEQRLKAKLDRVNSRGSEGGRGGSGDRGDPITVTTRKSNVKDAGDQGERPSLTQVEPAKRSSDVRMQAFGDKLRAKLEEADSLKRKSSAGDASTTQSTAQKISRASSLMSARSSNGSVESLQAAASQRRSTARLSSWGSKLRAKLGQADSGGKNGILKDPTTTHLSRSSSVGSKNEQQTIQHKGSFNGSVAESLPVAASQRTSTLRLSNFDAKLKAKLEEADSVGRSHSEKISATTNPSPSTSVLNKNELQRTNDAEFPNRSVSESLPVVASQRPSTVRLSNFDDKLKAKLEGANSFGKNHIKYDSPKTARSTISSVGSSNLATATTSRNSMSSFASDASRSSSFVTERKDGNDDSGTSSAEPAKGRIDNYGLRLKAKLDRANSRGGEAGHITRPNTPGSRDNGQGRGATTTPGNNKSFNNDEQRGESSYPKQVEPFNRPSEIRVSSYGDKLRAKLEEANSSKRNSIEDASSTPYSRSSSLASEHEQRLHSTTRSSIGSVESQQAAPSQQSSNARLSNFGDKLKAKLEQADSIGGNPSSDRPLHTATAKAGRNSSIVSDVSRSSSFANETEDDNDSIFAARASFENRLKAKLDQSRPSVVQHSSSGLPPVATAKADRNSSFVSDVSRSSSFAHETEDGNEISFEARASFENRLKTKLEESRSSSVPHNSNSSPPVAIARKGRNSMGSFASEASRSSSLINETEDGNVDGIDVARASFEIRLRDKLEELRSSLAQNNNDHESRTVGALHPLPTGLRSTSFGGTAIGDGVAAEEPPMSTAEEGGCIGSSTPNPADDLHDVEGGISPTTDAETDVDVHGALNVDEALPVAPGSCTVVLPEGLTTHPKNLIMKQFQNDMAILPEVGTVVTSMPPLPEQESVSSSIQDVSNSGETGLQSQDTNPGNDTIHASVRRSSLHVVPAFLADSHVESLEVIAAEPILPWWKHRRVKIFSGIAIAFFVVLSIIVGVLSSGNTNNEQAPSSTSTIGVASTIRTNSSYAPSISNVPTVTPTVSPTQCQSGILSNVQTLNFEGSRDPQIAIDGNNAVVIAFDPGNKLRISFFSLGDDGLWTRTSVLSEDTFFFVVKWSLALNGKVSMVGFPSNSTDAGDDAGLVCVYEQNDDGYWTKVQQPLLPQDGGKKGALFGRTVQLSHDGAFAAVGAYGENTCYFFRCNGSKWNQLEKSDGWQCLTAGNGLVRREDEDGLTPYQYDAYVGVTSFDPPFDHASEEIHSAIATDTQIVLSTSYRREENEVSYRGVSVLGRLSATKDFELLQFIDASNYAPGFGSIVTVNGDLLIIGSSTHVYFFKLQDNGTWEEILTLTNSEISENISKTGWSNLAVSGKYILASTIFEVSVFDLKSCV